MATSSYYNDPDFSYTKYWQGREYEHQSEVIALNKLLKGSHFTSGADIGGGYGRLIPTLAQYCQKVVLVEPSLKQRLQAKSIKSQAGTSTATNLPDSSLDFASIVRVLHHLPDPLPTLHELHRILKPNGVLVLEFANSLHFLARFKSLITGQAISRLPVERRRPVNIRRRSIPFVNHHPEVIFKLLSTSGFVIKKTLSVSNFRSPFLKKILPLPVLLFLESIFQSLVSSIYFGPSIFVLAIRKW
ncbi:MAG: class I SAM-dependent methyltransferase [Patescibacteria group bacterium]